MSKSFDEYYFNYVHNPKHLSNRIIFHIDVNNAFLSWTAVSLLNENPHSIDIRKVPSIIAGDETKRHGIVLAKSTIAKELGIKTAEPIYLSCQKVKNLQIYPSNYSLFKKYSDNLYTLFLKYTPLVERYSIDECFLDVTDYLFNLTPLELAIKIQKDIFDTFNFTVNIGIANCKILAKTASDFTKPNKIHILFNTDIQKILWPLDISKLFTVGKQTEIKLKKFGIHTIYDLANTSPTFLRDKFGKIGIQLFKFANGIDNSQVISKEREHKSISCSTTLKSDTFSKKILINTTSNLINKVCYLLRKQNLNTGTILLSLKDYKFNIKQKSKNIKHFTNSTDVILKEFLALFDEIYFNTFDYTVYNLPIRQINVTLTNFQHVQEEAQNLFDYYEKITLNKKITESMPLTGSKQLIKSKKEKNDILNSVIDNLNKKYGNNTIKRGTNLI